MIELNGLAVVITGGTSGIGLATAVDLARAGADLVLNARRPAPEALAVLTQYSFPGNVRELKNVLERAVILVPPGTPIGLEDLPPELLPTL